MGAEAAARLPREGARREAAAGPAAGRPAPGRPARLRGRAATPTPTGSAASGGGSTWGGSSNPGSSSWSGGTNAIRPRDEVFQRPGFSDVYNNRGISRNNSVPSTSGETPWYSRPRGETPSTGTAMLRTDYDRLASSGRGGGNPGWDGGYYPGYGYPDYPGYGPGWGYYVTYGWYMYPWPGALWLRLPRLRLRRVRDGLLLLQPLWLELLR